MLDREATQEISFTAVAVDQGSPTNKRSATVPVFITLQEENDNKPHFTKNLYEAIVAENVATNAAIIQVQAYDNDTGDSGILKYSIKSGGYDMFKIDPDSGIIYPTNSFEGHTRDFILTIEAIDNIGKGPYSDSAEVRITVVRVNQNKPIFVFPSINNESIELPRNLAEKHYLVMTVIAEDQDSGENGRLTYHFKVNNSNVQETNEFVIDELSGEVKTKQDLSNDEKKTYELILVVKDSGIPSAYETLRFVTITKKNYENSSLKFVKKIYKFYVDENMPRGTKVGKVQAVFDERSWNGNLNFQILSGNEKNHFYIDNLKGEVLTNIQLDREQKSSYDLTVAVSLIEYGLSPDSISLDNVAHIIIFVNDLNDSPPFFIQSGKDNQMPKNDKYRAGISSKASIHEVVTFVTARDDDYGENSSLELSIQASYLYKYGFKETTIGSIVPSPFSK